MTLFLACVLSFLLATLPTLVRAETGLSATDAADSLELPVADGAESLEPVLQCDAADASDSLEPAPQADTPDLPEPESAPATGIQDLPTSTAGTQDLSESAAGTADLPEPEFAPATDALELSPAAEDVVTTTTDTGFITKYGNVYLHLTCDELSAAGYEFGDVVTVAFLDQSLDIPLVLNYTDVDSGCAGVFSQSKNVYVCLSIYTGDFATTYGIATKTVHEDQSVTWDYPDGVTGPIDVTISMKEKGGYYDEFVIRNVSYTNDREDYPDLTDEQFANFREVGTTGMGAGVLYRSSSPINPAIGRSSYADQAYEEAGVTVALDLAEDEATATSFEGYDQTYYAGTQHLALNMDANFQGSDFRQKLAQGLRFMAQNPGTYAINCKEGKDRTGFVIAVLECFMGASYDEVIADYMESFSNFYGVEPGEKRYDVFARSINKSLSSAFGVDDLQGADLAAEAEDYLRGLGLTDDEIEALRVNLSGATATHTVTFDANGHGTAPEAQVVESGSTVERPDDPVAAGYVFGGWYTDAACTSAYDFATPVTQDVTLYAKWTAEQADDPDDEPSDDGGEGRGGTTPHKEARVAKPLPATGDDAIACWWMALPGALLIALGLRLRRTVLRG